MFFLFVCFCPRARVAQTRCIMCVLQLYYIILYDVPYTCTFIVVNCSGRLKQLTVTRELLSSSGSRNNISAKCANNHISPGLCESKRGIKLNRKLRTIAANFGSTRFVKSELAQWASI